jgi:putative DNA primase/helicase
MSSISQPGGPGKVVSDDKWAWLHSRPIRVGRNSTQYREPDTTGPLAGIIYWRDMAMWRDDEDCWTWYEDTFEQAQYSGGPLEPGEFAPLIPLHVAGYDDEDWWSKLSADEQQSGVFDTAYMTEDERHCWVDAGCPFDQNGQAIIPPPGTKDKNGLNTEERLARLMDRYRRWVAAGGPCDEEGEPIMPEEEPVLPPPATPLEFAKRRIAEGKADGLYAANLMNRVAAAVEQALQAPPPAGWEELAQSVIDAKKPALVMLSGDQITPRIVEWIWKGWLAKGKFHLLAGKPGIGKSTLVFSLLAAITRGGPFPDGSRCEPAYVVLWSNEDDAADTIVPRLIAAGADMSMVRFPDGVVRPSYSGVASEAFHPARHMADLTAAVHALQAEGKPVGAVMVDPVVSMFQAAGRGASNNAAETRDALQPLSDFARDTGVAVIGVTHFTKGTDGQDPLERVSGSGAFAALARIVWCAAQGEEGPARLVRVKSNVGPTGDGYEYTLEQTEGGQLVQWGGLLHGYARTLLEEIAPAPIKRGEKLEHATNWLMGQLYAAGDAGVPMSHLKAAAAAHGIPWRTVENARAKMGQGVETITGPTAGPGGRPEYRWRRKPGEAAPMTEEPLPWE